MRSRKNIAFSASLLIQSDNSPVHIFVSFWVLILVFQQRRHSERKERKIE